MAHNSAETKPVAHTTVNIIEHKNPVRKPGGRWGHARIQKMPNGTQIIPSQGIEQQPAVSVGRSQGKA